MSAKNRNAVKTVENIDLSNIKNAVESNQRFMSEYFEMFSANEKIAVSLHKFDVRDHKDFTKVSLFNHANADTLSYKLDKSLETAKTLEQHALDCNVKVSYVRRHIAYLLKKRALFCKLVTAKSEDKTLVKMILC